MDSKTLIESAVAFGRTCQSPRTSFLHLYAGDAGGDAIPFYENFCFALALVKQKTSEGVFEGMELFERLFAFQAPSSFPWAGNVPVYLHDFPRCWNPFQPLRIAPLIKLLLREYSRVLPASFKQKAKDFLDALLTSAVLRHKEKPYLGIWERRLLALQGKEVLPEQVLNSTDLVEELITAQLQNKSGAFASALIHPTMGVYIGPSAQEAQDGCEPKPTVLDWWVKRSCAKPHPLQIELAALSPEPHEASFESSTVAGWCIQKREADALSFAKESPAGSDLLALRWIWQGTEKLHSLVLPTKTALVKIEEIEGGVTASIELPELAAVTENDLFEVGIYCDLSTHLTVEGKQASVFNLNDEIHLITPTKTFVLSFSLKEGEGEFLGHLMRANRPFQTACKGALQHEAFDWYLALRTLRRSPRANIEIKLIG